MAYSRSQFAETDEAHDPKDGRQSPEQEKEQKIDEEAEDRSAPSGKVVYHAIVKEADDELQRSVAALFWSGLAAGLSMGFSLVGEAILRAHLPDEPWRPLVSKIGYSFGFLIVILGRQQLFTENTLTPMLPLMQRKDAHTFWKVMRLWGTTLLANLIGALAVAAALTQSDALSSEVRHAMREIGTIAMEPDWLTTMIRGIFAGWLIAILVWMLPASDSARFWVILLMTWLVGVGEFAHIIAGSVETFGLAWSGYASWGEVFGGYVVPTLIGNIIGGVTLVAGLNHAQVVGGEK
jgi:formate/nitrite transporter FocA (FNT family)